MSFLVSFLLPDLLCFPFIEFTRLDWLPFIAKSVLSFFHKDGLMAQCFFQCLLYKRRAGERKLASHTVKLSQQGFIKCQFDGLQKRSLPNK